MSSSESALFSKASWTYKRELSIFHAHILNHIKTRAAQAFTYHRYILVEFVNIYETAQVYYEEQDPNLANVGSPTM